LNTISNLGGTFPRYFVLKAVDYFTKKNDNDIIIQDGYYIVGILCGIYGIIWIISVGSLLTSLDQTKPFQWSASTYNLKSPNTDKNHSE